VNNISPNACHRARFSTSAAWRRHKVWRAGLDYAQQHWPSDFRKYLVGAANPESNGQGGHGAHQGTPRQRHADQDAHACERHDEMPRWLWVRQEEQ
jgi:hypothetical protein